MGVGGALLVHVRCLRPERLEETVSRAGAHRGEDEGWGGVQGCSVKQRGDEGEPAGETEWWPARTGKPG